MFKIILTISTFYVAVSAIGQLSILQSPKSIDFKGNDELSADSLGDVFAATLGLSIDHPSVWKGLYVNDPFNTAKSVVAVIVDGINKVNVDDAKTNSYDISGVGAQDSIDSLVIRIQEHNSAAVDLDLTQGLNVLNTYTSQLGEIKPHQEKLVSSLKPQLHPEDKLFLEQISAINALADKLETLETLPAFIAVRLSLSDLVAVHSLSSPAITDALKLLSSATDKLSAAIKNSQNDGTVFAVVAINDVVTRTKRAASANSRGDPIPEHLNLGKVYNQNYPVIFNIILWFGVVMVFSLIAISYAIANMDPGRDSIIYRMTSTRMKKDN